MKITKEYLRKLIVESLDEIKVSADSHHPGYADTPETEYGYTRKAGPSGRYDAAIKGIIEVAVVLPSIAAGIKTYNKHDGEELAKLAQDLEESLKELQASMSYS